MAIIAPIVTATAKTNGNILNLALKYFFGFQKVKESFNLGMLSYLFYFHYTLKIQAPGSKNYP